MTRPLRVNVAGGWYHVWSRGVDRKRIFRDDHDRYQLLEVLGRATERYGIVIHAYVLMSNHYHAIIETPADNLSKAMQWISTSYSMWHNRRHGRVGPLFQGRYGSSLIEDSQWAYELSVYLHLNPVRTAAYGWGRRQRKAENAGLGRESTTEEVSRIRKALREYRWSSYRSYAGYEAGLQWVERKVLLKRAKRGKRDEQKKAYREDVQGWIDRGVDPKKIEQLSDSLAVGSEKFISRLRDGLGIPGREESGKAKVRQRRSFADVIRAVERQKGERWEEFRGRRGDWGKGHVYWFAREMSGMTLREVGAASGGLDYGAVSEVVRRYQKELAENRKLLIEHRKINDILLHIET